MCGDYFLIPLEVDLDGDGQSTTLMARFDTGGAGLHIDPDAVVRAGGGPVEERKQITIRDAIAGPLTFPKLRPYTRHLDHLSRPIGIEALDRASAVDRVEGVRLRGPPHRTVLPITIAGEGSPAVRVQPRRGRVVTA
jgi:hypothetical protein